MHASVICLVVLSIAATLASSRPGASYLTQSFRELSSLSYKRQSSSIPSQCTSTCDPVQSESSIGWPITACCTQSFETTYYNCLLCAGTAYNTTDYTQAQTDLDQLYVACVDYGYSLQELTFPGQNPSRTLSTSSRAGTSTVAGTSPASVSVPTILQTTILPSSTSPASSGKLTSASSTATSSTSTPATSGAALGLARAGGSGVWALVTAAIGLIVLRNS
ncbi:uncharacterized protein BJ212DRAFT_1483854 [Suillus subaureus]|uniref:Extracellular membrane protein CFEM domain-containing protein n=1 Tax=Suillus subaureus TaxID=48587 RepID=A0A9P7JAL5_9AGAM|nr:uncharacterized protein BJ212DRAFT_1483854 [Suillus subaureus]KAG1811190.1 hypothetical protein BJ212DRAFT_1483854 [Suillus subaureus]